MGKSVAFFENGSWYHRTKVMNDDYTVGYATREAATRRSSLA